MLTALIILSLYQVADDKQFTAQTIHPSFPQSYLDRPAHHRLLTDPSASAGSRYVSSPPI